MRWHVSRGTCGIDLCGLTLTSYKALRIQRANDVNSASLWLPITSIRRTAGYSYAGNVKRPYAVIACLLEHSLECGGDDD